MKRTLFFALLIVFAASAMAQSQVSESEMRINMLVSDGLERNFDEVVAESVYLTEDQKYRLYHNNESDPIVPFVVNLLVGVGVGSFIQGDLPGGLVAVGFDVAGLGLLTVGYVIFVNSLIEDIYTSPTLIPPSAVRMMLSGGALISASRIFQFIRPFLYSRRYNDDLRMALRM